MACPCYFLLHLVLCIQSPLGWESETFPDSPWKQCCKASRMVTIYSTWFRTPQFTKIVIDLHRCHKPFQSVCGGEAVIYGVMLTKFF